MVKTVEIGVKNRIQFWVRTHCVFTYISTDNKLHMKRIDERIDNISKPYFKNEKKMNLEEFLNIYWKQ